MKILYLADDFPPQSSSAGIIVYNLAKEMIKLGHQPFVVTIVHERGLERTEEMEGIKIYRLYYNFSYHFLFRAYLNLYNPFVLPKARRILQEVKPDVVHADHINFYLPYYILKLAKKTGAKVFLTAHDVMLVSYGKAFFKPDAKNFKISVWQQIKIARKSYNPFRNIIIKHYLKYVDKIFTVSNALKRVLEDNGIKNIEAIHNGIDVDCWRVSEEDVKKFKNRFGLSGKKIIFWGGGRLSGAKGAVQILKAFKIILEKFKTNDAVVLTIAGNKGLYTDNMEIMARNLGLGDKIVFTGQLDREEMKTAFFACDISVTPSVCFDSFPTVNLEAMASQKPVVATCFGGSPEIVIDGETGYIVNPNDESLLAEKILDLLQDSAKAKEFGFNGYERVRDFFSLKKQAENTLKWYELNY